MEQEKFRKEERLCSKRSIDDLFRNGSSFVLYPYRVVFRWIKVEHPAESGIPVKVLFSVPKRNFRKAVDRNLIKRRMREAYRLQKSLLLAAILHKDAPETNAHQEAGADYRLDIAVQYIATESKDFSLLYGKMADVLSKLRDEYVKVYLGEDR